MVARAALLAANLSEASFALSSSLIFMEVVSIFMRSPMGVFLMKESLISSRNVCLLRRLGDEGLRGGRISEGRLPGVVGLLHKELLGMVHHLIQVCLLHAGRNI